jgi:hypothetical protein
MPNQQAPRDDNHIPTILGEDNVTGETKPGLIDNISGRLLVDATGTVTGQQYTDGDTDATPTGTLSMGFDGTNTINALLTDSDGHLQVDVLTGGGGGSLVTDGEAVNGANTAVITVGTDGSNYRIPTTDTDGDLQVDVASQDGVAVEGAALGNGILIQGDDGTDRKNINVDATTGDVQVDVTNTVTVDGSGVTQPVSAASLPLPTGAATAANQLPDGHNVTVDNASLTVENGGTFAVQSTLQAGSNTIGSVESDGTALSNGQVTADTTAGGVTIVAASAGRQGVIITNQGSIDAYIGTGTVSTSNGFFLGAGESVGIPTDSEVKGITASSSTTIGYLALA